MDQDTPVRYGLWTWLGVPAASLLLAAAVYGFTPAKLCQPIRYGHDAFPVLMWAKTLQETGWWMSSDRLGAPGRMEMHDYPANPTIHFALMKLLALGTRDPFLLVNAYFLLTFPLVTLTSLATCRALRIPPLAASVCGLLFAFLPYHFWRGPSHLFLASYFLIPLAVLVAVWLARGEALARGRGWVAALVCFALGLDFPYYPVFGGFFLAVAGLIGVVRQRSARPFGAAVLLGAVTAAGLAASHAPNFVYRWQHGPNGSATLASKRSWVDSEQYALKLSAMLLPASNHPLESFRQVGQEYLAHTVVPSEGESAALGVVGAVGLVGLLGLVVFGRAPAPGRELPHVLASLTVAALLLATVGGFGAFFSLTVQSTMRAYVRMSVFVGFFALLGVAVALARLHGAGRPWLYRAAALALLAAGLPDQVLGWGERDRQAALAEFASDAEFIHAIEASLPRGGRVFQLPHQTFLDITGPCIGFDPYTHFRGYLHSRHLHWSYGAVSGRGMAAYQEWLAARPAPELVEALCLLGFDGIYLDRKAYYENADKVAKEMEGLLGPPTLRRADGRLLFFPLAPARAALEARTPPERLEQMRAAVREPVIPIWSGRFDPEEREKDRYWRWCGGNGELHLHNRGDRPRTVRLTFEANTISPGPARLAVECPRTGFHADLAVNENPGPQELVLEAPPGETVVHFRSDAKPVELGRTLIFAVRQYRFTVGP